MLVLAILLSCVVATPSQIEAKKSFIHDVMIKAVRRESSPAIEKINPKKKFLNLREVLDVLTTFRVVSRDKYAVYDHQIPVRGSVELVDGSMYLWGIEPNYAATITDSRGNIIYLLCPDM